MGTVPYVPSPPRRGQSERAGHGVVARVVLHPVYGLKEEVCRVVEGRDTTVTEFTSLVESDLVSIVDTPSPPHPPRSVVVFRWVGVGPSRSGWVWSGVEGRVEGARGRVRPERPAQRELLVRLDKDPEEDSLVLWDSG